MTPQPAAVLTDGIRSMLLTHEVTINGKGRRSAVCTLENKKYFTFAFLMQQIF